ncbi:MAG TPA: hypothetical protein VN408_20540 [Actinoplanes sp.]|nr:hypothetical protein [Actinoplanes sp.]
MDTIPQDITEAVRAAAAAAPGYRADLGGVQRRARRRRNRQTALAAAGVAAVLAVAGFGTAAVRERSGPAVQPAASAGPGAAVTTRPLVLTGANGSYRTRFRQTEKTVELDDSKLGVLDANGWLTVRRVPGVATWNRVVGTATGGVVALGTTEGSNTLAPATRLVAIGPDGTVTTERDMSRDGRKVDLLAATPETAYLWRPEGLAAHDLATGTEKMVMTAKALDLPAGFDGAVGPADLVGQRIALVREEDVCTVDVLDVPSGRQLARLTGDRSSCEGVTAVRLSPDGTMVAVGYEVTRPFAGRGPAPFTDVTVFRIADGKELASGGAVVLDPSDGSIVGPTKSLIAMTWHNSSAVRAVLYPTVEAEPIDLNQLYINW